MLNNYIRSVIKRASWLYILVAGLIVFSSCQKRLVPVIEPVSLHVFTGNKLVVSVDYNFSDYYQQSGMPMGYQYDLLEVMAKNLGYEIEWVINRSVSESLDMLLDGKVDLVASGIFSPDYSDKLSISNPLTHNRQILLQRKGESGRDNCDPYNYTGKLVLVKLGSSISSFIEDIAPGISLKYADSLTLSDGIKALENYEADFMVCDEFTASAVIAVNNKLEINPHIQYDNAYHSWLFRSEDYALKDMLNEWMDEFRNTAEYALMYERYFNKRTLAYRTGLLHKYNNGTFTISPYDNIVQRYCTPLSMDWRYVSAVMFHESRFKPGLESGKGAFGLMQVLPSTASYFGVTDTSPSSQILSGIRVLNYLDNKFKETIFDSTERLKFVTAAYNAGIAHIIDARRIADAFRLDSNVWDSSVETCLLQKTKSHKFSSDLVMYGQCNASETNAFVHNVMDTYSHYVMASELSANR